MPLDIVSDDDVDLFEEDPLEDDLEGEFPIAADDILLIADAPTEEAPVHSPVPDPFEYVASAPLHTQGVQHHSHDVDPDMASSAVPVPAHSFEFDHDVDDDPDPIFPPEDPVVAPRPDLVPVPFNRAPFATHIDPRYAYTRNGWIDDDDDYPPFVIPVTPPVAPVSAPVSAPIDVPLLPTHTTDARRTDLPITFLQDIPPPRHGEGSSRQPFGHTSYVSGGGQFVPQISHPTVVPTVAPFTVPSFTPPSAPFL
ncbi:pollen-specific leucine-rich repeat extensin-like protein 1 [Helianthus annuus]|uniref:pollen-specific leucine-rich repeat extensin-like protein 1 n=1 Tax=Helianthus annuus TaxID=4232 RepID=UPI000B8FFC5E|nr:pollen-specific leucine-rich repeat extensin-like protein 1 [Helianthus annuus]